MNKPEETLPRSSYWANLFRSGTYKDDLETLLLSMPPFQHFDKKHLNYLMKIIHNRVYSANEFIFLQGDPGVGLYIIKEGEVLVTHETEEGFKIDLARFERGDFLGEIALLDNESRSASAVATKETQMAVIFKPDLDEFIEKYPKFGVGILRGISKITAKRLRNLNDDFFTLYTKYINLKEELINATD